MGDFGIFKDINDVMYLTTIKTKQKSVLNKSVFLKKLKHNNIHKT